jgi:Protein of unknown function (DUF2934)
MARKTTSTSEKISTRTKPPSTTVPVKRHKKAELQAAAAESPRPLAHEDVARLAFSYWEHRGRQHGSPEADWARAEQELLSSNG